MLTMLRVQEELALYPYAGLLQFGGCRGDFAVTLGREGGAGKERLTFALPRPLLLQATLLTADYIKLRRVVGARKVHSRPSREGQ